MESEIIEKDSDLGENISDIIGFLLPCAEIQSDQRCFGLHFNRNVFDGWVKQPSACCAAAALAGAFNCLSNMKRSDINSMTHDDVLDIYKEIFLEIIKKKIDSFERLLGAPFSTLIQSLDEELKVMGKVIGGRKHDGANKALVMRALRAIVMRQKGLKINNTEYDGVILPPILSCAIDSEASISIQSARSASIVNPWDALIDLYKDDGDLLVCDEGAASLAEHHMSEISEQKKWDEMVDEDELVG
jgi:hypothetical protein